MLGFRDTLNDQIKDKQLQKQQSSQLKQNFDNRVIKQDQDWVKHLEEEKKDLEIRVQK